MAWLWVEFGDWLFRKKKIFEIRKRSKSSYSPRLGSCMRLRFVIMLLGAVLFARVARPRAEVITYYVQLVRACDGDKPPEPNSKRVGPRLMKKFQGPLKWNDYWEIGRQEVALQPGQVTSLPL